MEKENSTEEQLKEEKPTILGGLKGLGLGLIILGAAYYFYITMTSYEQGEGVTMNRLLLLAYAMLGKNITTGILSLLGAFITYSGIKEMITAGK